MPNTAVPQSPIRAARFAVGSTQFELCARSGVSLATLHRAETGSHTPRDLTLARLAKALGVPAYTLRGDQR